MRLFGCINSRIAEAATANRAPEVGMGCTINLHSDCHAATIIDVLSPTRVRVQQDTSKLVSGSQMSESQEYEFTPNPEGTKTTFSKRKNGLWIEVGSPRTGGTSLTIGERDEYYDPTF